MGLFIEKNLKKRLQNWAQGFKFRGGYENGEVIFEVTHVDLSNPQLTIPI